MQNEYLIYIAILIAGVLIIGLLVSGKLSAFVSAKGFRLNTQKTNKDNTKVSNVKGNSDIDITATKDRNYDIDNIDNSKVQIKWAMLDNKSDINGSYNNVIQDINNSNVIINQRMTSEELLESLKEINRQYLLIFVVTVPRDYKYGNHDVTSYYGENSYDWKPYQVETIRELLNEYTEKSGFDMKGYLLDFNSEDRDIINLLKNYRQKSVFLVNVLALDKEGNKKLVSDVINQPEVGGCLVLGDEKGNSLLKESLKKTVRNELDSLWSYSFEYSEKYLKQGADKGYYHIDLETSNKNILYRKLTQIAMLSFGFKFEIKNIEGLPTVPLNYRKKH